MRVGIPIADLSSGLFCAMGILIALLEREQSGKGQQVATSLLQAQIFMLDFQGSRWLNAGEVPKQAGNNHPTSIPTGVFKTRDGHINIATAGATMWERLCRAIGAEALLTHPDYATAAARSKNRDALSAELESCLASGTSAEWVERLNAAEVPCGPIYSIDQIYSDPQVRHLQLVQDVEAPDERGVLHLVGQPMTLTRTPSRLVAPPPERGQHTEEVLREAGFSDAEIAALRKAGVV
jgi:formyl-CoA transferase